MDERRLAALETLSSVVRWLKETKPSEIFYVEGEGKGKTPAPTMQDWGVISEEDYAFGVGRRAPRGVPPRGGKRA
ncbi:MAG: hypothetical protein ACM3X3_10020 [Betaproteobacteria bacterium]